MDYEYSSQEPYEGRVLWGRVAVYGVSILLAFVVGSCVGGRGQVSESELTAAQQQIGQLESENEALEQQIAAVGARAEERPRVSDTDDDTTGAGEGGEDVDGEGGDTAPSGDTPGTYTVQPEDTLYDIAVTVYGDGNKFRLIADANGLDSTTRLQVGQVLTIPPDS